VAIGHPPATEQSASGAGNRPAAAAKTRRQPNRSLPVAEFRAVGIAAAELASRTHRWPGSLNASALARWLLDGGLAVEQDGLLVATPRGPELGAGW
jgi:hypothetical protein